MIGSVAAQGDQAADVSFHSRIEMVSHFLWPVGDNNQGVAKDIEQLPFDLFKYPLRVPARRVRVDDDQCPHLFFRTFPSFLHRSSSSEIFLGEINRFTQTFQDHRSPCFIEMKRNITIYLSF
jgi:hypothetical protein